eukprot:UN12320
MQRLFNKARQEKNPNTRMEVRQKAMEIKDSLCLRALNAASIIIGTCLGSCNKYLMNFVEAERNTVTIDTILVDEATQIHEPELLSVINCISTSKDMDKRMIMIGDPKQLSPIIKTEESKKLGYGLSLFERLLYRVPITKLIDIINGGDYANNEMDKLRNFTMLNIQYRGYDLIHNFSNTFFYNGKLKHHQKFDGDE